MNIWIIAKNTVGGRGVANILLLSLGTKKIISGLIWCGNVTYVLMPATSDIEKWCKQHYVDSPRTMYGIMSDTWKRNFDSIIMTEKVYIHYKLCE